MDSCRTVKTVFERHNEVTAPQLPFTHCQLSIFFLALFSRCRTHCSSWPRGHFIAGASASFYRQKTPAFRWYRRSFVQVFKLKNRGFANILLILHYILEDFYGYSYS